MKCTITSLYLCVIDMERAIKFYESFFEKSVDRNDPIYSIFEIGGFRLGLFAFKEMKEEHSFGSNCLPSIEVESLAILKAKTNHLEICFPLTKIQNNWVIEFIDSEGNHIEVTTPV